MNALGRFFRERSEQLGMSMAELARRSGKSRQTLHAIGSLGGRMPEIETLVDLALVLQVHPLRLIHLVFEDYPLPVRTAGPHTRRGDKSIFVGDVTIPDGTVVLAGTRFTKTWELQNVGTVAWEGRTLRCMDEEIVVMSRTGETLRISEPLRPVALSIPVPYTAPGELVRLSVDFVAPKLPGTCVSYWKSFCADGRLCLPKAVGLTCKVRVLSMATTDEMPPPAGD